MKNNKTWNEVLQGLDGRDKYLALESNLHCGDNRGNYLFIDPVDEIVANNPGEVAVALDKIDDSLKAGLYAAGIFSYELGYCLEEGVFEPVPPGGPPLLHVGLYRRAFVFDTERNEWLDGCPPCDDTRAGAGCGFAVTEPVLSETPRDYVSKIEEIKRRIERGDTYQINYTIRMNFNFDGSPLALYLKLRDEQRTDYSALWRNGGRYVLSLSPELFFKIDDGVVEVRPMKGTVGRGVDPARDASLQNWLRNDEKNLAENLMIVDLMRNDLGRISLPGTVDTPALFRVEPYETVSQMTSTVRAKMNPDMSLRRIFASMFPSGSVTGAPKISSMRIIRELETKRREIYTGAVGFIAPGKSSASFNVAIRTVDICEGRGELGIGGGIVYDSVANDEWREALLKSKFFTDATQCSRPSTFSLIETLLWKPGEGFILLDLHLERLARSAAEFEILFDADAVVRRLSSAVEQGEGLGSPLRVRLLLDTNGDISVTCSVAQPEPQNTRCAFSRHAVLSGNLFLKHKSTVRQFYDLEHDEFEGLGFYDVVYTNERGEVTEGARNNICVRTGGELFTPPVSCGLLPGVFRENLLRNGMLKEHILYPEDITGAEEVYLCNSVRGMVKVCILEV